MKVAVAEVEVEVEVLLELVDVLVMVLEIEAEVEVVESIVVLFVEVAVLAVADVVEVTSVVDPVDGGEAEVDELVLVDETNDEVMLLEVIELEGSLEPDVGCQSRSFRMRPVLAASVSASAYSARPMRDLHSGCAACLVLRLEPSAQTRRKSPLIVF